MTKALARYDPKNRKGRSPSRSTTAREIPVVGLKRENCVPIRYGDFGVNQPGCGLMVHPPDSIPVVLELKPITRSGESTQSITKGGEQQVVCHMAKYVSMCFNFAGAGVDCHATCALVTLAYMQIIQLHLVETGTKSARLELKRSPCFPFFQKEICRIWLTSNHGLTEDGDVSSPQSVKYWMNLLYGEDETDVNVPSGFKALYKLLTASSVDLFGSSWTSRVTPPLGSLIGAGSFSYVFAKGSSVTKVSRVGRSNGLVKEAAALKLLGEENGHSSIPHLQAFGLISLQMGSAMFQLPRIQMTPKANTLAAERFYSLERASGGRERLMKMATEVEEALKFVHSKGISHNDVSLQNILIQPGGQALLADYTIASTLDNGQIPGLTGTPPTSHRDVHSRKSRVARPFHDFASLGFVCAILCMEDTDDRWSGEAGAFDDEEQASLRVAAACSSIKSFLGEGDDAEKLKGWVLKDNESYFAKKKSKGRKSKKNSKRKYPGPVYDLEQQCKLLRKKLEADRIQDTNEGHRDLKTAVPP